MSLDADCNLVEATLIAREGFLSIEEVKRLIGTSSDSYVKKVLERLRQRLERRGRPFKLVLQGSSVRLRLREQYLERLTKSGLVPKVRLSKGVLKTLALIAYQGPHVFQKDIVRLRGKHIYEHIRLLSQLGFIETRNYQRTKIIRPTQKFLSYFGLEGDIESIPSKLEKSIKGGSPRSSYR